MLKKIPTAEDLIALIGQDKYDLWQSLCSLIESNYDIERLWNSGGKKWTYEYKYRRGGKTLCALYAKQDCFGFMIIFGKNEREKFEAEQNNYSQIIQKAYNSATTYHDGKWVMFEPADVSEFNDYLQLLKIKRKPIKNRN